MPFTLNNSEQRSQLTCYRGCWHVISRWSRCRAIIEGGRLSLLHGIGGHAIRTRQRTLIPGGDLRQTFVHCGIFLAAASRRSLGRISVPSNVTSNLGEARARKSLIGSVTACRINARRLWTASMDNMSRDNPWSNVNFEHQPCGRFARTYPG